mmetsp:Transcript_30478/g.60303  ORF Transcript_30478/g.60303 Transcript_30478/m.60303 type:complete len:146 (+) Transcript_30478:648-1085(+)
MLEAAVEEDAETALQRRMVQRWRAYAKRRAQHSRENKQDAWGFAGGDGVTCWSLLLHPSSRCNGSGTAGGAKERDAWGFASPRRNKKKRQPATKEGEPARREGVRRGHDAEDHPAVESFVVRKKRNRNILTSSKKGHAPLSQLSI